MQRMTKSVRQLGWASSHGYNIYLCMLRRLGTALNCLTHFYDELLVFVCFAGCSSFLTRSGQCS